MRLLLTSLLLFVSISGVSQAAFLHEPLRAVELPVLTTFEHETIYGVLAGFPHTFTFTTLEEVPFSMQVAMSEAEENQDVSLILVKEEKRGVSEVGRLDGKISEWILNYDIARAITWAEGSKLTYTLEPGTYKFEISSPENNRGYRLVLGAGDPTIYSELSMVRTVFGAGSLSMLLSPYVFGFILIPTILYFWYRNSKKKYVS